MKNKFRNIDQLKAGSLLTYLTLFISTIIPLFYTPVMLRMLGQSEYGLYSLANSIISYLSLLTVGLGSTIIRYLMKYKANNDKQMFESVTGLFVTIYSVIALLSCLCGTVLALLSDTFFSKGLTVDEVSKLKVLIIILSVSTAVSFISSVYSSIIICYEKFIFKKIVDMILTVFIPITNLVVLFFGYASVGMSIVSLILQILTLFINYYYCKKVLGIKARFKSLPKNLLPEIFTFTFYIFIGLIADLLYWATDKVLIGAMLGTLAVAVYNIGSTFNSLLQNLAGAISGVFGPRVNTLVFENRPISDISALMIKTGRIQYLIISLVLSGFIVFGKDFIILWAGSEYSEAYYVALLTLIPLAVPLIQNVAFTAICAQNKHQFRSILYFILSILNVIATYFAIPYLGIIGAALCTCIIFVLGHGIIMNVFYYKKIKLDIPGFWKEILKQSIVPCVLILVMLVLINYHIVVFNSLFILIVGVFIYTIIFCVLSWILSMNSFEKGIIINAFSKILRRKNEK